MPFEFSENIDDFTKLLVDQLKINDSGQRRAESVNHSPSVFLELKPTTASGVKEISEDSSFTTMIHTSLLDRLPPTIRDKYQTLSLPPVKGKIPVRMTFSDAFYLAGYRDRDYPSLAPDKQPEQISEIVRNFMLQVVEGITFDTLLEFKEAGLLSSKNNAKIITLHDGLDLIEKLNELHEQQDALPDSKIKSEALSIFNGYFEPKDQLLQGLVAVKIIPVAPSTPGSPSTIPGSPSAKNLHSTHSTQSMRSVSSLGNVLRGTLSFRKSTKASSVKSESLSMDPQIQSASDNFKGALIAIAAKNPEYISDLMWNENVLSSDILNNEVTHLRDLLEQEKTEALDERIGFLSSLEAALEARKNLEAVVLMVIEGLPDDAKSQAVLDIKKLVKETRAPDSRSTSTDSDRAPEKLPDRTKRRTSVAAVLAKQSDTALKSGYKPAKP